VDAQIYKLNTLVPELFDLETSLDRPMVKFARGDGEELQLGYSVTRLSDPEDQSTLGSLVVFQDLTKIAKMEESLRMSEKLAAVGKLAAGIAHEIRNPLAGISGSAQLLRGSEHLDDEDKRLLAIIQRESLRLDALITEFLEYVRPQKPKFEEVHLNEVVREVIEGLQVNPKWNAEGCKLLFGSETNEPFVVKGDRNKITQALINFVLNSGQAGARRVEIRIDPDAHLHVVDDGHGISPEHQARLFEPFFTTKEAGTGLGLATSYRALEAMEARISVRSPVPDFCDQGGTMVSVQFKRAS
jgi:two-component system sensor histidine kinase PilS (NtrC family)